MGPLPTAVASTHGYTKATDFISHQFKLYPDRPLTRYFSNETYKILTYAQIDHLATNLAFKWSKLIHKHVSTVALLGAHDIDYFIILIALMKLELTVLLISPRNSLPANVDLLEKTRAKFFIANTKLASIAKSSVENVPGVQLLLIETMDISKLLQEPLFHGELKINQSLNDQDDLDRKVFIFHSSGSTSYPKPLYITNQYLLCSLHAFYGQLPSDTIDTTDTILCCTPLSHIFGFVTIFSIMSLGASFVMIQQLPASQEQIDFALSVNQCTIFTATPILLEEMIPYLQKKKDFSTLQRLKVILVGGAPMKRASGQWFHQHGIKVANAYGSTETGPTMTAGMDFTKDWCSMYPFVVDSQNEPYLQFEIHDKTTPHIKHGYIRAGCPILALGIPHRSDGGYDTNDLFMEDENSPGYYFYLGRRDDILIMENGEKTNPVPMETMLLENSHVIANAVVLGHGRPCTSVLVELKKSVQTWTREAIEKDIQAAVKKTNEDCPNHSKLFPPMVKILKSNEHLPINVKGAVIRHLSLKEFGDNLDLMYHEFLFGITKKKKFDDVSIWTMGKIESFLLNCTQQILQHPASGINGIDQHQSLFDLGLDSISAIQLRNKIAEHFPDIPLNFIFQHQTLSSMIHVLSGQSSCLVDIGYQKTHDLIQNYISKIKSDFPTTFSTVQPKKSIVVLLTGATGSLGSFLLRDLLQRPQVKKIYCLIRLKGHLSMKDRLYQAFTSRSLDPELLNTDRIKLLPLSLSEGRIPADPMWGLTTTEYDQLKSEVTIVQHCGWHLDFNMPIDYFNKTCIEPFYQQLFHFVYRPLDPIPIHFISSVSATALWDGHSVPEETVSLSDPSVSLPMGYAQSKFVVEALFSYLRTEKNWPCYIERLGQVSGDTHYGIWNTQEQFPMLFVGGGSIMHSMPDLVDTSLVDWIPVDIASECITDIMLSSKENFIHHIVNPHRIMWSDVLKLMKESGMQFEIISLEDWIKNLSKDETNPCYGLLSFFQAKLDTVYQRPIYWETEKTAKLIPRLNDTPVLNLDLFKKFLTHWSLVGFYDVQL